MESSDKVLRMVLLKKPKKRKKKTKIFFVLSKKIEKNLIQISPMIIDDELEIDTKGIMNNWNYTHHHFCNISHFWISY